MKRALSIIPIALVAVCALADDATVTTNVVTNLVSEIRTVKEWKRTYIIGKEGGRLTDPTGTIADYATGAALAASARHSQTIMDGAYIGLTNALESLYAVTNNIGNFDNRIYLAGDLQPDDTARSNLWCYIPKHSFTNGVDTFWVWYSHRLGNAPRMQFRYRTETAEELVDGVWEAENINQWSNQTYTVDGYEWCHKISTVRPQSVGNMVMNIGAYPRFGTEQGGFDFARKAFTIDNELPFTGAFTNVDGFVESYINGVFVGENEDESGN